MSKTEEGPVHPFIAGRVLKEKPVPRVRLRRKDQWGKDIDLEVGIQDTFLDSPPVPFRKGKPLQPVDREEAERQMFEGKATKETAAAAREQRHAIRRSVADREKAEAEK